MIVPKDDALDQSIEELDPHSNSPYRSNEYEGCIFAPLCAQIVPAGYEEWHA